MRADGVGDDRVFAAAPGDSGAEHCVRPFVIMGHRLAHVVEQAAAPRAHSVEPELTGDHAGEARYLDRMLPLVLRERQAELEATDQGDDLVRCSGQAQYREGFATGDADLALDVFFDG